MEAIAAMIGTLRIMVLFVWSFFMLYAVVALGRIWCYSKKEANSLREIEKSLVPYIDLLKMRDG
jgi:hypothetical protein